MRCGQNTFAGSYSAFSLRSSSGREDRLAESEVRARALLDPRPRDGRLRPVVDLDAVRVVVAHGPPVRARHRGEHPREDVAEPGGGLDDEVLAPRGVPPLPGPPGRGGPGR